MGGVLQRFMCWTLEHFVQLSIREEELARGGVDAKKRCILLWEEEELQSGEVVHILLIIISVHYGNTDVIEADLELVRMIVYNSQQQNMEP